jgi:putative phosphoribosyl transferase
MFRNRDDAARQLAERLRGRTFRDPLVLAIPRGGVVVGAVLARELGAELDVVLARKLRAPGQPELALGAVSETGEVYLNHHTAGCRHLIEPEVSVEREYQLHEIARRRELYRGVRPAYEVCGRSVIVTDDGLATGSTMIAALKVVCGQHPHELIAAVPVAPPDRLCEVREWCDEVMCLLAPPDFFAIGQHYTDFSPVEDAEVVALLGKLATPVRATA